MLNQERKHKATTGVHPTSKQSRSSKRDSGLTWQQQLLLQQADLCVPSILPESRVQQQALLPGQGCSFLESSMDLSHMSSSSSASYASAKCFEAPSPQLLPTPSFMRRHGHRTAPIESF